MELMVLTRRVVKPSDKIDGIQNSSFKRFKTDIYGRLSLSRLLQYPTRTNVANEIKVYVYKHPIHIVPDRHFLLLSSNIASTSSFGPV